MALTNLKTPGVYVQEIPTLPASIVPVETAIPAFFGYTEKGPLNTATRVTSLIEYSKVFGGAYKEPYVADLDSNGDFTGINSTPPDSPYLFFYHLQMYFANGGGPCHIVSVGHYDYSNPVLNASDFFDVLNPQNGIGAAELVDEVTLLVAPEVTEFSSSNDIRDIYNAMLAQCNKLKDRFSIFDVKSTGDPNADGTAFRNSQVGTNFLNYGAAYYPPIDSVLTRSYSNDEVLISDGRGSPVYVEPNDRLSSVFGGLGGYREIQVTAVPASTESIQITIGGTTVVTFYAGSDFPSTATLPPATADDVAAALVSAINAHPVLSLVGRAQFATSSTDTFFVVSRTGGVAVTYTATGTWTSTISSAPGAPNSQDIALYNQITDAINAKVIRLGPSATMAGIYASVDNDRGVWKAPANVSVTNIIGPSFQVTESQQGDLNVDATSGKSINAIRSFVGRGTLVWGARTLAGNDNEWRYVPVRRLFIMAEESTKKASEFVVFEPNDKNTWLRVKGMITNFLTDLWKQGALAGDKPDQAFFVRVGLGETMTAQDILEGKMIVTIGMAAVRPAEFIILQFEHKLQEA